MAKSARDLQSPIRPQKRSRKFSVQLSSNTPFDLISIAFVWYEVFLHHGSGIYIQELNLSISNPERTLFIFVFVNFWILLCPLKRHCNRYWLSALMYQLLPCMMVCSEAFFQYQFRLGCAGVLVLLFIICGIVMRTYSKIGPVVHRGFYSRIFVLISAVALIIPVVYSAAVYQFKGPLDVADQSAVQAPASAETAQLNLDLDAEFYKLLEKKSWDSANWNERIQWMQLLVSHEAFQLGLQGMAPVLYTEALPEFILGYYDRGRGNKIIINVSYLETAEVLDVVNTVLHELYHYYQDAVIDTINWESDFSRASYFDDARRWQQNSMNYNNDPTTEEGIQIYLSQPLENDANAYAKRKSTAYALRLELEEKMTAVGCIK